MENEYTIEIKYDDIASKLMNLEAETNGLLNFVVSYSVNTVTLTATSLECLIATVAKELWWLFTVDSCEKLAEKHYSLIIKNNKNETIFCESAETPENASPYIWVSYWTESTMDSIARDLLRDLIPSKGAFSSKSRQWNLKKT